MTRNEFINKIKRRVDRGKSLPITLGTEAIEDIIEESLGWFYDNYNDACTEFITLLPADLFKTEHFKSTRWIEFGECVYSVYDFIENRSSTMFNYRLSGSGLLREKIINTLYYTKTYDIVTYIAYLGYDAVLNNLKDNFVEFKWNKNQRRIHVTGHDPRYDMIVRGFSKVPDTALFEDNLFQKYVEGMVRIALGEVLSVYTLTLPAGASINADTYITRGESMIEEVKEDIKDLGAVNYMMEF